MDAKRFAQLVAETLSDRVIKTTEDTYTIEPIHRDDYIVCIHSG